MARRTMPSTYTGIDPYRRLAGAIVLQAVTEARRGNPMAAAWLESDDAAIYLEYCRLDSRYIYDWIANQKRLQNGRKQKTKPESNPQLG